MRITLSLTSMAFISVTHAFCPYSEQALKDPNFMKRHVEHQNVEAASKEKRQSGPGGIPFTTFSTDQLIDVTGDHAWVAPGPDDIRGPCPGLNALANHGYFPHNGVVPLAVGASATQEVYGKYSRALMILQ